MDCGGGKGVFEEGVLIALVVDLRRGENGAGHVIDDVSGVDRPFKHVLARGVLHDALQLPEDEFGVRRGQGVDLPLQAQRQADGHFGGGRQTAGAEVPVLLGQGHFGGHAHLLKDPPENEGPQISGDDQDVLALLQVGGDAAGDLLVAVSGYVDKDGLGAADCRRCVGGDPGGGGAAPEPSPELDAAQLPHGRELPGEPLVVIQGDLKSAHGHHRGDGVPGCARADYGNAFDHNSTLS